MFRKKYKIINQKIVDVIDKIDKNNKKIDWLTDILEKSNLAELVYILGSKKEIIRRNILARDFKRSRYWNSELH